ncbi:MAG: toll/interleukin-1 receptor domain-containing protein [Candidatus Fibromonas sp.]|jgi:hypothetical protein|nr:toll/interleukin-1 receptor domain-containing protein [Candidatus Fibromonas sp.]
MSNFNIFISYRRKGGFDTAKLIYDRLRMDGYSVSFDIDTLENGDFGNELEKRVKKCKDFLVILSPGVFDCFSETGYDPKDDWVRREIVCALQANKNIIPLLLDDFAYPKRLPADIKELNRKNGIEINPKLFETSYEKLKQNFLRSKPYWKIRYKKKIRWAIATLILAFVVCLTYFLLTIYQQKNLEVKECKTELQKANYIIIEKEIGLVRIADSLRITIEVEMMRKADSILNIKEKFERTADSMAYYLDSLKKMQSKMRAQINASPPAANVNTAKPAAKQPVAKQPAPAAKQPAAKKTQTKGSSK